jgi:hypothetical protein
MAQSAGALTPATAAAIGIQVAAASNNLAKGVLGANGSNSHLAAEVIFPLDIF